MMELDYYILVCGAVVVWGIVLVMFIRDCILVSSQRKEDSEKQTGS